MRLIDADLLKESICEWLSHDNEQRELVEIDDIAGSVMIEIDEQPTAYDVDKVIEALRESESYSCSPMFSRGIETAIDKVKRGGVE